MDATKPKTPNWLSRQFLLELQKDFPAYFLKILFLFLVPSFSLMEQGVPTTWIVLAAMLTYCVIHFVIRRIDPNLPPDSR